MIRAVGMLGLLTACDTLFLERNPFVPDAAPDAPVSRVTGTIVRRVVRNAPDGTPMMMDVPPTGASAFVRFDDGTQVRIVLDANGAFAFDRASDDTRYALVVTLDGRLIEVQHRAPTISLAMPQLGPPNADRVPITEPTLVLLPIFTSGTVITTGLWTASPAINAVTHDQLDWLRAAPVLGRRALLSAARYDVLYYLGYSTRSGSTYPEITSYFEESSIEMADGATIDLRGKPVTTADRNGCTRLTAPQRSVDEQRFIAATPGYSSRGLDWMIGAAPEPALGPLGETRLAFLTESAATPVALDVGFTNPIRGTELLASLGFAGARSLTYPGANGILLGVGLRHYQRLDTSLDCAANARAFAPTDIGIAGVVDLSGVRLDSDSVVFPIDRAVDPQVSWSLASPGMVDRFDVSLVEILEDSVSGLTTTRAIRTIQTTEPRATIDNSLLINGGYYLFVVVGRLGHPGAATGDVSTVSFPYTQVVTNSGMFQVQ